MNKLHSGGIIWSCFFLILAAEASGADPSNTFNWIKPPGEIYDYELVGNIYLSLSGPTSNHDYTLKIDCPAVKEPGSNLNAMVLTFLETGSIQIGVDERMAYFWPENDAQSRLRYKTASSTTTYTYTPPTSNALQQEIAGMGISSLLGPLGDFFSLYDAWSSSKKQETKFTVATYMGSFPNRGSDAPKPDDVFVDDAQYDYHRVVWNKLGSGDHGKEILYTFQLSPHKGYAAGNFPIHFRVVLPLLFPRNSSFAIRYVELEWKVDATSTPSDNPDCPACPPCPDVQPSPSVSGISGKWWIERLAQRYQIEITSQDGKQFTGKYSNITNPSTFSGTLQTDASGVTSIQFTQADTQSAYTATHTGKVVAKDRFEGTFTDNRGNTGAKFVLSR